jgi:hypothetical protein
MMLEWIQSFWGEAFIALPEGVIFIIIIIFFKIFIKIETA